MPNNNKMKNSRTDIDRLFEKGISDVSREPRKSLSEEEIAAAAVASKSGAGIWLLSHAKEILLCALSFVTGCLVMLAVLYYTAPKPSNPQTSTGSTEVCNNDSGDDYDETGNDLVNENDFDQYKDNVPATELQTPTTKVTNPTSDGQTANYKLLTPNHPEPVTVKKTVVQRDTVVINETVILKDTVYVP